MSLAWITEELDRLAREGLLRIPKVLDVGPGPEAVVDGRSVLLFCSNDYLGLAGHPALRAAASEAIAQYGVGACSSRLVSGTQTLHRQLERRLTQWLGAETGVSSTLVMPAGFMANLSVLTALAGPDDLIFSDELNHASIVQGCRLSRARVIVYPHNNVATLKELIAEQGQGGRHRLIVTDAVFSVDGDEADLATLSRVAKAHDAALVVDEAHSLGVMGPQGRGLSAELGVAPDVIVGTFGKAFGCSGAFVAGSEELTRYLESRAVPHIYTTASPPSLEAAVLAAIDLIEEAEDRRQRLHHNATRLRTAIEASGCSLGLGRRHIVPTIIPGVSRALAVSAELFEQGVFVQALRPPTVAPGTERLRWTPTSEHSVDQIDRAAAIFADVLSAHRNEADS